MNIMPRPATPALMMMILMLMLVDAAISILSLCSGSSIHTKFYPAKPLPSFNNFRHRMDEGTGWLRCQEWSCTRVMKIEPLTGELKISSISIYSHLEFLTLR
jgi:hypothetical protein